MQFKSPVLQNSLQLLSEIRSSLSKQSVTKQNKKQSYVQFEYDQQEEPRIYPPEFMRVEKQVGSLSSANLTEEILESLRCNSKQFEKQCYEIEKQIKEIIENIEADEDYSKPKKRQ